MKIMKTCKLAIVLLVLILTITILVPANIYAYDYAGTISTLDSQTGDDNLNTKATNIVGAIIAVTRIIAVGIAFIMLAAVAMKYMSSAPGDRAEIKKHAVIYVVGAVVLFGASGILTIIQTFASGNL